MRIPAVLRTPDKVDSSSISTYLALMHAGLSKMEGKLQTRINEAADMTSEAGERFRNDKTPLTVSVRASELLGMAQTLSAVLNLASFKRAANQASAAAANIDTLRVLGEGAGRTRRRSGAASTLSQIDADIANYVLDEFASAKQLNAADVAAADEAASVASATRGRGVGSGGSADELMSMPSGSGRRAGSGGIEGDVGSLEPQAATKLQEEVAVAAAAVAAAEASAARGGSASKTSVSGVTISRFRKGISAVDSLLHATGKIAADAVDKQEAYAGLYLDMVAPGLPDEEVGHVLDMLDDVGDWDLDVLELERAVSFPHGVEAARAATEELVARGPSGPKSPSEAVGPAGSGGGDGLAGMRRFALPFLGMLLLRRHGFLLADGESPQEAAASARIGLAAVSLKQAAGSRGGAAGNRAGGDGGEAMLLAERQTLPFLQRLADGYRSNPYHSATHAIDVMYTAHCVVLSPHLHGVIRAEHRLAMLLGAALHDFRHDGTTNALHAKLHSALALRYNDQSVLENMHVSEAFALMRSGAGELDVLSGMGRDQQRRIREAVVDTVLATDMRFHFRALEDFEVNVLPIVRSYHAEVETVMSQAQSVKRRHAKQSVGGSRASGTVTPSAQPRGTWASMPSDMSADDDRTADSPRDSRSSTAVAGALAATVGANLAARYRFGGGLSTVRQGGKKRTARLSVVSAPVAELQEHSMVIAKLAMHAADVSNPVKPLPIYRKWAARCMCEFYHVGDSEREAKLPISTFFDRDSRNMPKCQIGFITFVVRPLFAALSELVSDLADEWKTTLDANQAYFETKLAEGKTDDDPCVGDWFEFDPSAPREGAVPATPFDLP